MGSSPTQKSSMKLSSKMASFLEDRELEYLVSPVKITVKRGLPKIETSSFEMEETTEGELLEVPRWASEVLVEMGFAEVQEEPFEVEVFKALSRERMQGPLQLSTLKGDFYLKMRRHLGGLKLKSEREPASKSNLEKLSASAYDLIALRLSKLLYLATSSSAPQDFFEKITAEEREVFNEAHGMVDGWRKAVLEGAS